ncbi:MAG: pyruvate kinase [bacterium]|jgi:pyruvate kinase|nr:pyruvate kinase [bacterium]
MRRTKIVCTIGPASESPDILERLVAAGMDVARLNFSHGDHASHAAKIRHIRRLAALAGRPVAILQDLAGPKVRIGTFAEGSVTLRPGDEFTLTAREVPGDVHEVSLGYKGLAHDVEAGDTLLLADGALELKVLASTGEDIRCRVVTGGELGSRKGINLPSRSIRAPILSEQDRRDLAFGLEQGVDYVALSFVRSAADVEEARAVMEGLGGACPLIAKIEKHEALAEIDAILAAVEGLMVARGDLGVDIPLEEVPRVQKLLIEKANRAGKPVITATQMLRSMVESPRPTRAEVADVANAILDGTDAVMLSEETAAGAWPVVALEMMDRVARATERDFPHRLWMRRFYPEGICDPPQAVAHAACDLAWRIGAAAILTCTMSGGTARHVARYRPAQLILAATPDEGTWRRLALCWGCVPLRTRPEAGLDELIAAAEAAARAAGLVGPGDPVVVTAGHPFRQPGTTNLIRVDLCPLEDPA